MAATAADTKQSRLRFVRVPPQLDRQIDAVAARDANSYSATIRRLIALGPRVVSETERDRRG